MISKEQVLQSLQHIIDPDLGRDIVSLGFVKNIEIEEGTVRFSIELTTPACPVKERFRTQAEAAVQAIPGVERVEVTMTAMEVKRKPSGPSINTLEEVDAVIAVSSCKGGVGKSTVAAHLARAIQREGHQVGILDTDIYGPSFPTLFNAHNPDVYMKDQKIQPVVVDGLKTMSLGFMMGDKPAIMRGPMVANYTMQLLRQTDWGKLDYLIIDLPPGTGDIQLTLVQQAALDGAIIVTTPQTLSLVDVARGILMFEKVNVPVLGIVENMSWFECDACSKRHYIFGNSAKDLSARFGLRTLAELPIIPGVSSTAKRDDGAQIQAFADLAENLHREMGKRRIAGDSMPVVTPEPGRIRVTWPDGTESRIANKAVRASCQCALCVNEFTGEQILHAASIPDDIAVEDVQTLGNYAVAIMWSDGHSSGIFSWDHLRQLSGAAPLAGTQA
ncbi:MAG: P-loop NTPase [Candidatus Hydrogenedentes bacterium]|nr:P-loop NTPase [Candidatus Hydrogenedentota bacterium]